MEQKSEISCLVTVSKVLVENEHVLKGDFTGIEAIYQKHTACR
jgi:hypothetical protein